MYRTRNQVYMYYSLPVWCLVRQLKENAGYTNQSPTHEPRATHGRHADRWILIHESFQPRPVSQPPLEQKQQSLTANYAVTLDH